MDAYSNREFDASQIEASARSAAFIVPVLCKLFPWIRSVINVGCGTGTWLHEFDLHGIPRLLGLESGNVPARLLQIEPSQFRIADFGGSWGIEDRFDLVLSLEIAQQLPPECVENFVGQLTNSVMSLCSARQFPPWTGNCVGMNGGRVFGPRISN